MGLMTFCYSAFISVGLGVLTYVYAHQIALIYTEDMDIAVLLTLCI